MSLRLIQEKMEWDEMKEELDRDMQRTYQVLVFSLIIFLLLYFFMKRVRVI